MSKLGNGSRKRKGWGNRKIHNPSPGALAQLAYGVYRVTGRTQKQACKVVGAKLFNLTVIAGSSLADRRAFLNGEISFEQLTAIYRLTRNARCAVRCQPGRARARDPRGPGRHRTDRHRHDLRPLDHG